jgi:hypothetical protein
MKRIHISKEHMHEIDTSIDYINQIIEKIKSGDDADIENSGRRPIRELLQNSDDAEASLLVLRFDKDRLWLYNNGRSMKEDYLRALSTLGGASKKEEANTSGSFGTGFRSTHMFTDTPELEWSQWIKDDIVAVDSRYLTFQLEKWKQIEERKSLSESSFMKHKDEGNYDKLGVFFSFPWRTSNETGRSEFDEYLWNQKRVEELAYEIQEQSSNMLMGCRHLKKIRIILTCAESVKNNFIFEVTSDTSLSQIKTSKPINGKLKLTQESFAFGEKIADLTSKGSWGRKNHQWYTMDLKAKSSSLNHFNYHWCKKQIFSGASILDDHGNIEINSKRYWNLLIMYFPLNPRAKKLPIYTPIPLGGVSKEYFGIVGFCPPDETRRNIDTGSPKVKKFITELGNIAIELYAEQIFTVAKIILDDKNSSPQEKEQAIIQLLPRDSASTWLSDSITNIQENAVEKGRGSTGNMWNALDKVAKELPIACIEGKMELLSKTIHTIPKNGGTLDQRLSDILDTTNRSVLNQVWSEYYDEVMKSSKPKFRDFLWKTIFVGGDDQIGFYGSQPVENIEKFVEVVGECLDELMKNDLTTTKLHKVMLDLVQKPPHNWLEHSSDLSKLFVLRDAKGKLHSIDSAIDNNRIIIPDKTQSKVIPYLKTLIGEEYILHANLKSETIRALEKFEKFESLKLTSEKMVWIIDKSTDIHPDEHDNLGKYPIFHEAVSNLLSEAVSMGLNRGKVKGKKFIPVFRNKKIQTLEENTLDQGELIWNHQSFKISTPTQGYHREFIFHTLDDEVYSSLPQILKKKLRFLKLHQSINKANANKITSYFTMNMAINNGKPLNLVRTLLTEQTGGSGHLKTPSLFKANEFLRWWNDPPLHLSSKDEKSPPLPSLFDSPDESKDKHELLLFLLNNYQQSIPQTINFSGISEVPYLLTAGDKWIKPSEASTCSDEKLLQKIGNKAKALHPDIVSGLGEKILSKMGVSGSIKISQATELMKEGDHELSVSLMKHFLTFLDFEDKVEISAYKHHMTTGHGINQLWAPEGFNEDSYCQSSPEAILWPDEKFESFLKHKFLDLRAIPDSLDEERKKKAIAFFNFSTEITFDNFYDILDKQSVSLDDYGFNEGLGDFQKYVSKNKVGNPDDGWREVMAKQESTFLLQGNDGKVLEAESGAIFTTPSNKSKWESFFQKNKFIQIFSHDEIIGGKGFCQKLIDFGFGKSKPEISDLIFELKQQSIEPHIAKLIWKELGKQDQTSVMESLQSDDDISTLYFERNGEIFDVCSDVAINDSTETPLLDSTKLVISINKLPSLVLEIFIAVGVLDLRNITSQQILRDAIDNDNTKFDDGNKKELEHLINTSENELFALLQHNYNDYELIDSNKITESLQLDEKEHQVYRNILVYQKTPILCNIDSHYDSRLQQEAIRFSTCKPTKVLKLDNLNATPNSLMEKALQRILTKDAISILDLTDAQKDMIESIEVKMIQKLVPQKLEFTLKGVLKSIKLNGKANEFRLHPATNNPEFFLSQDRDKCNASQVATLVLDLLSKQKILTEEESLHELKALILSELQEESDSLFESNNARETSNNLRDTYMGCQIESCGRYTPTSDQTKETAERRKSFLGSRTTFYSWKQTVDSNYPIGQNVWLCPRHHTLWERGLIRFKGIENKLAKADAKRLLPNIKQMAVEFTESTLDILIYDGEGRTFDAKWNDEKLLTHEIDGKNHGQSILDELTKWVQDQA